MSAFTPWTMDPGTAGPAGRSFHRRPAQPQPPHRRPDCGGPLKSFVLVPVTFGILPLISWPRRFGKFVVAEQQQVRHLSNGPLVRTGDNDAAKLLDSVRDTGAIPTCGSFPWSC